MVLVLIPMTIRAWNVWQDCGRLPEINCVNSARLVCIKTSVAKLIVNCVGKVGTTTQLNRQQSMPAKNAQKVHTRRRWVLQKNKTATNVLPVRKTASKDPTAAMIARIAKQIHNQRWRGRPFALFAAMVPFLPKAVHSAPNANREKQDHRAWIVLREGTEVSMIHPTFASTANSVHLPATVVLCANRVVLAHLETHLVTALHARPIPMLIFVVHWHATPVPTEKYPTKNKPVANVPSGKRRPIAATVNT